MTEHKATHDPAPTPHAPAPTPQHNPVIPRVIGAKVLVQQYEDTWRDMLDKWILTFGELPAEQQIEALTEMDHEDARRGLRERRSDVIRGRMAVLAEGPTLTPSAAAPKDPTPTPKDPSVAPKDAGYHR
jgi:hypothetical protein